jgi:hypothetical protein
MLSGPSRLFASRRVESCHSAPSSTDASIGQVEMNTRENPARPQNLSIEAPTTSSSGGAQANFVQLVVDRYQEGRVRGQHDGQCEEGWVGGQHDEAECGVEEPQRSWSSSQSGDWSVPRRERRAGGSSKGHVFWVECFGHIRSRWRRREGRVTHTVGELCSLSCCRLCTSGSVRILSISAASGSSAH